MRKTSKKTSKVKAKEEFVVIYPTIPNLSASGSSKCFPRTVHEDEPAAIDSAKKSLTKACSMAGTNHPDEIWVVKITRKISAKVRVHTRVK